jgi:hypothetical protein
LLSNVIFIYGLATQLWQRSTPLDTALAMATLPLLALRTAIRMFCCARVYGFRFALGVPLRSACANALNSAATFQALARYTVARVRGRPLKWLKTEHAYPSHSALLGHKRPLGELLTRNGLLSPSALAAALASQPPGARLGEHLVNTGQLSIQTIYESLSMQQGLPLVNVDLQALPAEVAHVLPERIARQWKVLPFRVADGGLFLASPEIPTIPMNRSLENYTNLELRFHLVTPAVFEELSEALL